MLYYKSAFVCVLVYSGLISRFARMFWNNVDIISLSKSSEF